MLKIPRFILLGLALILTACTASGQINPPSPEATRTFTPTIPSNTPTLRPDPTAYPGPTIASSDITPIPWQSPYPQPLVSPSPAQSPTPIPTPIRPTPTLSPSLASLRIAFINDPDLYFWQNDTATLLTDVEELSRVWISDDGEKIVFGQNELWVINSDGTGKQKLISAADFISMEPTDPGVNLNQVEWIPNTDKLLFNTRLSLEYGLRYTDDLYTADVNTLHISILRHPGEGGNFLFSPDGQQVAIITPRKISVMGVDGSGYRTLLEYEEVGTASEFQYYPEPVWAKDSQSLMVAIPPANFYSDDPAPMTVWHLLLDETPAKVIAEFPIGTQERVFQEFISPDLSKIIYLLTNHLNENEMHISNIDGTNDVIFPSVGSVEDWAPDSEHFVFMDQVSNTPFMFKYFLGEIGEDPIPLSEPSNVSGGFYWLDDSHFLYLGGQNGLKELRIGTVGEPSILIAKAEIPYGLKYDFTK